jgi:hypothetical protein
MGRWMLLLVLEDLEVDYDGEGAYVAECSAYLFDGSTGKSVWRHTAVRRVGPLGPMMMMEKLARGRSLHLCFLDLMSTFPAKK